MGRRWPAVVCALALAAGCRSGAPRNGAGDPPAPQASTTTQASGAAAAGFRAPTTLGILQDPDIPESSGLVASRRNPGLLWTHNDSGDGPFVYCFDPRVQSCGVWRVTGADALDWEDIAIGPGPEAGRPYLYLGDIGDNLAQRDQIVVYRVPEPVAGGGGPVTTKAAPAATAPAETIRLRYPDGPQNAETLLVHPTTGDLYVIAKNASSATVYKAPAPLDPTKVTVLSPVGALHLGAGLRGPELVTGGDLSPDGRRVAVVTYSSGYELALPSGTDRFDAIWDQPPTPVAVGLRLQGESVAYRLDGGALLTTSEMIPTPVQQVERR
ncbi:MAG: hypothetical protein M3066_13745 [Actinomycetota bacterium]|nr:hypothetical protein [Actinomycetota bacterium]